MSEESVPEGVPVKQPPLPSWGHFARGYFLSTFFGLYPLLVIADDITSGELNQSGPWWVVRGVVAVTSMASGFVWAYSAYRVPLPWWGRTAQALCLALLLVWFVRGTLNLFLDFETGDLMHYSPLVGAGLSGLVWVLATAAENNRRGRVSPGPA